MEITLNNVKTLDQLKGIIATKYPWVKMHSDYLSLKYQGVKLTIEPIYGLAALIYPQALAKPNLLVFIGAIIFVTIAGIFN